jgi:hypothetical protein
MQDLSVKKTNLSVTTETSISMKNSLIFLVISSALMRSILTFDLPAEIHIGRTSPSGFVSSILSLSLPGAIFDQADTLSRQAFEYAVAKINTQSQIFSTSKIVVNHIDMVDAHDSFSAYKMGKTSSFDRRKDNWLDLVCAQLEVGIAALFIGQLTPSLGFISSLTRQLHIPLFLSSPDPQTKVEYYIINVYPHFTATSQAFSDLIKFQQWSELAIITERAESKLTLPRMKLDLTLLSIL